MFTIKENDLHWLCYNHFYGVQDKLVPIPKHFLHYASVALMGGISYCCHRLSIFNLWLATFLISLVSGRCFFNIIQNGITNSESHPTTFQCFISILFVVFSVGFICHSLYVMWYKCNNKTIKEFIVTILLALLILLFVTTAITGVIFFIQNDIMNILSLVADFALFVAQCIFCVIILPLFCIAAIIVLDFMLNSHESCLEKIIDKISFVLRKSLFQPINVPVKVLIDKERFVNRKQYEIFKV